MFRSLWAAWWVASFFYAYQYILRVMPNIMFHEINAQFEMTPAVFGQFSGAYYVGYCAMHMPLGMLLDRFGPRRILTLSILCASLGLLPLIYSQAWWAAILGRALIGMGSSAAILGVFKVIRMGFSEHYFTRMLSFSVTIGLMGAMYGGAPVAAWTEAMGHTQVIKMLFAMGMIFALLTWLTIPGQPREQDKGAAPDAGHALTALLCHGRVWAVCLCAGLMVGPLEGFADAWGTAYLKQAYGWSDALANGSLSLLYMGMACAPLLSVIAEKTGRTLATILGAGFVMMLFFIVMLYGGLSPLAMQIGFFVVGIACAYQILAIYQASRYVPEHLSGLTTALANMIIMSFGYLFHSAIGITVSVATQNQVALPLATGVAVVPWALALALIGFFALALTEKRYF